MNIFFIILVYNNNTSHTFDKNMITKYINYGLDMY